MVVSRYTEELKRVKAAYFKIFKSFNAEIHCSEPSDFQMFTYSFVQRLCGDQDAYLTWSLFVSNSKVLRMQDMKFMRPLRLLSRIGVFQEINGTKGPSATPSF
jgi:hypothetical protein